MGGDVSCTLLLADDQRAIAENKDDFSYVVRKLQEAYERRGPKISKRKCEYVLVGNSEKMDLHLEDVVWSRQM
jgi:hypothetical protein